MSIPFVSNIQDPTEKKIFLMCFQCILQQTFPSPQMVIVGWKYRWGEAAAGAEAGVGAGAGGEGDRQGKSQPDLILPQESRGQGECCVGFVVIDASG